MAKTAGWQHGEHGDLACDSLPSTPPLSPSGSSAPGAGSPAGEREGKGVPPLSLVASWLFEDEPREDFPTQEHLPEDHSQPERHQPHWAEAPAEAQGEQPSGSEGTKERDLAAPRRATPPAAEDSPLSTLLPGTARPTRESWAPEPLPSEEGTTLPLPEPAPHLPSSAPAPSPPLPTFVGPPDGTSAPPAGPWSPALQSGAATSEAGMDQDPSWAGTTEHQGEEYGEDGDRTAHMLLSTAPSAAAGEQPAPSLVTAASSLQASASTQSLACSRLRGHSSLHCDSASTPAPPGHHTELIHTELLCLEDSLPPSEGGRCGAGLQGAGDAWAMLLRLGNSIKDHPAVHALLGDGSGAPALLQDLPQVLEMLAQHPEALTQSSEVHHFLRDCPDALGLLHSFSAQPRPGGHGWESGALDCASPSQDMVSLPESPRLSPCTSKRAWEGTPEHEGTEAWAQEPLQLVLRSPEAGDMLWPSDAAREWTPSPTSPSKRARTDRAGVPGASDDKAGWVPPGETQWDSKGQGSDQLSKGDSDCALLGNRLGATKAAGGRGASEPMEAWVAGGSQHTGEGALAQPRGQSPGVKEEQLAEEPRQGSPAGPRSEESLLVLKLVQQPQSSGEYQQSLDGVLWRKNGKKTMLLQEKAGAEGGKAEGGEVLTITRSYFLCAKCFSCNNKAGEQGPSPRQRSGRGVRGEAVGWSRVKRGRMQGARKYVQTVHAGLGLFLATYYGEHVHAPEQDAPQREVEDVFLWEGDSTAGPDKAQLQEQIGRQLPCSARDVESIAALVVLAAKVQMQMQVKCPSSPKQKGL